MFGAKARRIRDLETRVASLVEQRDVQITLRATALGNTRRVAEAYAALDDTINTLHRRLDRALRGCARWRAEGEVKAP